MSANDPSVPLPASPGRRAVLRPLAAGLLGLPLAPWPLRAQTVSGTAAPPTSPPPMPATTPAAPPVPADAASAAPVPPPPPAPPAVPAAWGPLLAQRLKDQPGAVGLAALQVDATGVAVLAAGLSRAGEAAPLDATARFEIGSVSKTFTALLLADAVERGELSLDGAVEEALQRPGEPPLRLRDRDGLPLRWRDLATHRSGLPRLPGNLAPVSASDPYFGFDDAAMREALRAWQPERARDAAYVYSNFGYGLLGHALVQVLAPVEVAPTGTGADAARYEALLRRRILEPLGLDGARVAVAGRGAAPTPGHDGRGRPVPPWTFEAMAGAGALVMDAATLGRYAQAALGLGPFAEHPLRRAFALAMRRHGDGPAPINPVGLGWLIAPLNGRTVFNHDGGTGGFSTSLWLDPSRGRATALLANAAVETADLALHLLDPVVPPKDFSLTRQPVATVGAERLAPLAGTYRLNPQFALEVTPRGDALWARATGQGTFQLFPRSARRFFARVTPLEIEFEGEDGVPVALTLIQGGQRLRFVRDAGN